MTLGDNTTDGGAVTRSLEPSQLQPDETLYELSKSDDSKFQTIKRAVWDEMVRRYAENPKEVMKVENGLLHRLFIEVTKVDFALARQKAQETPEARSSSLFDLLNTPGLAPERKVEILESARARLHADLDLLQSIEEAVDDRAAVS